jgi:hypothetical protein
MCTTLPPELRLDVTRAGPLLYRCVRRLGSFPWHNQPVSARYLDLESLATATVFLLRRHEANISFPFPFALWSSFRDEARQRDQWLHRLLFQCMSIPVDATGQLDVDTISNMPAGSNAHLQQAHKLVTACNKQKSEADEKIVIYGPPIVEITALPSSRSEDFRGFIPKDEFQSLLNILLASQLYLFGHGPERVWRGGETLSTVATSILNTMAPFEDGPGITWTLFNSALTTIMVRLLFTIAWVLTPGSQTFFRRYHGFSRPSSSIGT